MNTLSEQLFEQLCNSRAVPWERIATAPNLRTPDYTIWLDSHQVIVEIKQLDLNKADRQAIADWHRGVESPTGFAPNAHRRVRNMIGSASKQLHKLVKNQFSSIIILFDNTHGFSQLDHEDILNAMYGDEIAIVQWQDESDMTAMIAGHHFGGHRKMTPEHNRSVSAIGLLEVDNTSNQPFLTIFHNIYAEAALSTALAQQLTTKQYTIDRDNVEHYQLWKAISTQSNDTC